MFIVIEIDSEFSIGIDKSKNMIGIRLGFVGIHFVWMKFESFIMKFVKAYND